jgi:hypothetical protein
LQLAPGDSIFSSLSPKGRHKRSNPQLPLVPPKADPEKISKKGKCSQEFFYVAATSSYGQLPDSTLNTPVLISSNPSLPTAEVSKNLDFQKFCIEYSSFETDLKEERFEIISSPDIVKWYSLESLEEFPTLGFSTPPPAKIYVSKEKETSSPLHTLPSSSKT